MQPIHQFEHSHKNRRKSFFQKKNQTLSDSLKHNTAVEQINLFFDE